MLKLVTGEEVLRGTDPKCGNGYVQVQFLHIELGNLVAKQLVNLCRLFIAIQIMCLSSLSFELYRTS